MLCLHVVQSHYLYLNVRKRFPKVIIRIFRVRIKFFRVRPCLVSRLLENCFFGFRISQIFWRKNSHPCQRRPSCKLLFKSTNNVKLIQCMYDIVPLNIKAFHWIVPLYWRVFTQQFYLWYKVLNSSPKRIIGLKHEYLDSTCLDITLIVQNIVTWVVVEANNDHRFVMGAYTNYFPVGEFLTNSNTWSSYSPKFEINY